MAFVYLLQGTSGRFYLGATTDLETRLLRHNSGAVHSTKRLGLPLILIASREFESMEEALRVERMLKRWKKPSKAREFLEDGSQSSPDMSGLVASSIIAGPTLLS